MNVTHVKYSYCKFHSQNKLIEGADVIPYFVVFLLMMIADIIGQHWQQNFRVDFLLIACITKLWQTETRPKVLKINIT